ncbi:MAG: hypothetical protein U9N32_06660, partial [Spirochaetota bacterium]|nr:hypothetical protein [Spirochaetota bacterium]
VGDFITDPIEFPKASDLVSVKIAVDSENIYVMIRTNDGEYVQNKLGQKIHFYGTGAMYFDFWLAEKDKHWIGWKNPVNNKVMPWGAMDRIVEVRIDKVMEIAIPLNKFICSPVFSPNMSLKIELVYQPSLQNSYAYYIIDSIDIISKISFPLLELLVKR